MPALSRRSALILLGSTAFASPVLALEPPIPLRADEATRDAALAKVRADMLAAAKARDFKKLQSHLKPNLQLDFGGGTGIALFGRRLAGDKSLWDDLVWVLANGGRFNKDGSFSAPWTYTAEVGNLDAYEAGHVVDDNVPARTEPRADAPLVAMLQPQLVKVPEWGRTDETPRPFYNRRDWLKVDLLGKGVAWVEAKHLRSAVDYRANFEKLRGVWKMNVFIAGD